jgi:type IV secretion system protein VirB6
MRHAQVFSDSLTSSVALFVLVDADQVWSGAVIVAMFSDGRAPMPLMLLVGDALKAFLVISLATGMASSTSTLYWALTDGAVNVITSTINPKADANGPYSQIDSNLATMEGMLGLLDTLASGANVATGTTTDSEVQSATSRAKWFTGIGIAGPSVVGGAVLLNKIAVAPFILCLLFERFKKCDYRCRSTLD